MESLFLALKNSFGADGTLLFLSVVSLCVIGVVAAAVLFMAAKKFKIFEDPKIDLINEVLPGANCGGCGYPGCRGFAEACVKAGNLDGLNCPVGGSSTMKQVGEILGVAAPSSLPLIAVLRCNGTRENAPIKINYDGTSSCRISHMLYAGDSGCPNGCMGLGDCVEVCKFDALYIDKNTNLPVVDENKCVACGACVKACPRNIYELRPKGKNSERVYVACMNTQKGAEARKNCKVACIGCMKCTKVTESTSVSVKNALSYIDTKVDTSLHGPALIECCPTKAIVGVNIGEKKS